MHAVTTEPNLKKSTKGTQENKHLFGNADVTKIRKTHVVIYLSVRSGDAMYRVRESKSKLELFCPLFIELFCHICLVLGLNTFERSLQPLLCIRTSQAGVRDMICALYENIHLFISRLLSAEVFFVFSY